VLRRIAKRGRQDFTRLADPCTKFLQETTGFPAPSQEAISVSLLQDTYTLMKHLSVSLLLHDIRSAHNVGSIFRTADAAGVTRIHLSGTTPTPIDRFGRKRKDVAKVALGAEDSVPWDAVDEPSALIACLRASGHEIVALEQAQKAIDFRSFVPTKPVLLIVGNEVEGVSPELLSLADTIIEIPQHGKKESLNVSVACGIALYQVTVPTNLSSVS